MAQGPYWRKIINFFRIFPLQFRVLVTGVLADRRPASLHFFRNFDVPDDHDEATHVKSPFPAPPKPSGTLLIGCMLS